jgi:dihydrofolate reductase
MGLMYAELSISLDGFTTGPSVSPDAPMGVGGESLHDWMFADRSAEEVRAHEEGHFASTGAVVMGRTMADLGIRFWGDEPSFHAPVFIVTHHPAAAISRIGGTTYTFVTAGPEAALEMALSAAAGQDVAIVGGAAIVRHFLRARAIDELRLHIVPVLLGDGTPLFTDLEGRAVVSSATGTVDERGVTRLVCAMRSDTTDATRPLDR